MRSNRGVEGPGCQVSVTKRREPGAPGGLTTTSGEQECSPCTTPKRSGVRQAFVKRALAVRFAALAGGRGGRARQLGDRLYSGTAEWRRGTVAGLDRAQIVENAFAFGARAIA